MKNDMAAGSVGLDSIVGLCDRNRIYRAAGATCQKALKLNEYSLPESDRDSNDHRLLSLSRLHLPLAKNPWLI